MVDGGKTLPEETEEPSSSAGNLMESKTSHLDDELSKRLEDAFHKTTLAVQVHEVAKIASEYHPIDIAYAASSLPRRVRPVLFENLPKLDAKATFMINTDSVTRMEVFRVLDDRQIQQLVEKMPPDEAMWVLDDISDRRYRRILDLLDPKKASHIRELQKHSRHSAGGVMTNEFFAFTMDTTISKVASYIRDNPGIDMTRRVFVLDDKGELQGYVPARNLIVNSPDLPLRQVMRQLDHEVLPTASREEVVDLVERYKISALPVVDEENFLLGVITYEDVVEAIEDIADETIGYMGGTAEDVSEDDPLIRRFFARAPWLLVTLFGGLVSAGIMAYYRGIESELLAFIVFFIPLINGMSGNVGLQSSTVLVRSMAIGMLSSGKKGEAIAKEFSVGITTGVVFCLLCGVFVFILNHLGIQHFGASPAEVGIIVATGLLGATMVATTLGVTAPFFFAKMGVDPAIASGPIVTAFNDILSMTTYFIISGVINKFFFT